jgi:histidinol-phosphate aminotransferase
MFSRRQFLKRFGVAAAGTALPLPGIGNAFEPTRAAQPSGLTLLNSNENPYGPSAAVMQVMEQSLARANRYPDDADEAFIARVAKLHNVPADRVIPGCGSTEILRLAAEAFLGPGKKLILGVPTFEAITDYAQSVSADIAGVPLTSDYAHDLDAMLARIDADTTLVHICNPNNPTGSITPRRKIDAFLEQLPTQVHVVIDEAYHHFADSPDYTSFLDQPARNPRVIVARTFSKVYGMAGIRLGYGIAVPELLQKLKRYKLQDNLNVVAATAGLASLNNTAGTRMAIRRNAEARKEFTQQAATRGLKTIPSFANFVMMGTGRPAKDVIEHFRAQRILIGRPFPPMLTFVRVSVGTPDEMTRFWQVWDRLPKAIV